jgi:hypothetical protein
MQSNANFPSVQVPNDPISDFDAGIRFDGARAILKAVALALHSSGGQLTTSEIDYAITMADALLSTLGEAIEHGERHIRAVSR